MPYVRNAVLFLVPLIGLAVFQAATAPLRDELWKLSPDTLNAFLSSGAKSSKWNDTLAVQHDLSLRLTIYTWSVFILIGVVTGLLIPNRLSGEQAANGITAMSIGFVAAKILFGVNHMSWLEIGPYLGGAVLCAICVVWVKYSVAARRARRRVQ